MANPSFQDFYTAARKNGATDPVDTVRDKYTEFYGDDTSLWAGPTRDQFRKQSRLNATSMGVDYDEDKADESYDDSYSRGFWGEFGTGLARGFNQLGATVGTTQRMLGYDDAGRNTEDYWLNKAALNRRSPAAVDDVWDDPMGALMNPDFMAAGMGEIMPSIVPSIGTGVGMYRAGAGPMASALTMGGVAGHLEAAPEWRQDMLDNNPNAWETYANNLVGVGLLNAAPGGTMFGKMGPAGKVLGTGVSEAVTEWAEEPYMAYTGGEDVIEAAKRGVNVMPFAGMMGMGGGYMSLPRGQEEFDVPPPDIEPAPQTAEDIIKGNWGKGKMTYSPTQPETIDPVQPPPPPAPVQAQQEAAPTTNYIDPRLNRDVYRGRLEGMADELVFGGGNDLIQDPNYAPGESDPRDANGRPIIPMIRPPSNNPQWFQSLMENKELSMSVEDVQNAVKKANAGEKLGVRQQRVVSAMIDTITEERTSDQEMDYAREQLSISRQARAVAKMQPATDWMLDEQDYPADFDGIERTYLELQEHARSINAELSEKVDDLLYSDMDDASILSGVTKLIGDYHEQQIEAGNETRYQQEEGADTTQAEATGKQEGLPETLKRQSGLADQDIVQTDKIPEMLKPQSGVKQATEAYKISDLKGKNISYDVFAEDTRETFTVTEDAGKVMQKLYARLKSLKQLRVCVS